MRKLVKTWGEIEEQNLTFKLRTWHHTFKRHELSSITGQNGDLAPLITLLQKIKAQRSKEMSFVCVGFRFDVSDITFIVLVTDERNIVAHTENIRSITEGLVVGELGVDVVHEMGDCRSHPVLNGEKVVRYPIVDHTFEK